MNITNIFYFHKRRVGTFFLFCCIYYKVCHRSIGVEWEPYRLGIAGSIATVACECTFHIIDTINIRLKVRSANEENKNKAKQSTFKFAKRVFHKEGPYGFTKGISACFYGSVCCGFVYFFLYKLIKLNLYQKYGKDVNSTLVFFTASTFAEALTIIFYYPYDLVKCRL